MFLPHTSMSVLHSLRDTLEQDGVSRWISYFYSYSYPYSYSYSYSFFRLLESYKEMDSLIDIVGPVGNHNGQRDETTRKYCAPGCYFIFWKNIVWFLWPLRPA
jgi:hypothetical protein